MKSSLNVVFGLHGATTEKFYFINFAIIFISYHISSLPCSQSDYSSQRNFLSSATTVLSTGSGTSAQPFEAAANTSTLTAAQSRRQHTFQPVVVIDQQQQQQQQSHRAPPVEDIHIAFHQSAGSDSNQQRAEHNEYQQQQQQQLGRLDGIVSTPGGRYSKSRLIDSKRFTAILLETSVVELQRHLLTLTVQNQVRKGT